MHHAGLLADLLVSTTLNNVQIKSAMQLLWEEASSRTVDEWGKLCDAKEADIVALAKEFTSHAKKVAANVHRGVSQHTNGFFGVGAWYRLNLLVGNFDWKGGMVKANTYDSQGTKVGKPFNQDTMPNKPVSFGINNIRHSVKYDKTTLFKGYPAKRPFFPLASDVYQEVWASIDDMYPYQTKILFQYMGSPIYSLPAGHKVVDALKDVNKLPLYVASDIVVGESSVYADYIIPNPYALQINMYQEKTALIKDSMTGKEYSGLPVYVPPYLDSLGNSLMAEEKDYPLVLITYKAIQHTKSRTSGNYWVQPIDRDGAIQVSAADAKAQGLTDGDMVRLVSASNPDGVWELGSMGQKAMLAKVKVVQGMRPGVVAFALGFGHWMYGSNDVVVNGQVIKGDPRRAVGVHGNAAMRVDPHLKNVALQDLAGGSVVFYDTRVRLVKA